MLTCYDVANYFLTLADEEAGDLISNLKLQKLVYYAQAFSLAIYGKRLFQERIEAWTHGPVVPDLYHEFKYYGSQPIPYPKDLDFSIYSEEVKDLLHEVYSVYGQFSAWKLRDMTHNELPWEEASPGGEIKPVDMKDYFKEQVITA